MGRISKANKLEIEIINNVNRITNASSEEIESAETVTTSSINCRILDKS